MARRRQAQRPRAASRVPPALPPSRRHVVRWAALAVLVLLAAATDDRHVGLIADGRQMIRTAVAIAETGEIGQALGRDFTLERPSGDSVSRFGMAMAILQVPAAWLAPRIEAATSPGGSQAVFLLVPWLAVGVAAAFAGLITRELGGGSFHTVVAVALASLASPLGSYAFLEFSEPVQAVALVTGLWAALKAARAPLGDGRRFALLAGFAVASAVLVKSSLIVVAPFVLLPLIDPASLQRSRAALTRVAIGAAGPMALWALFEWVRFGRLFGGYPDDRFTHPWADGLWRLLIGPNRGFFLFWPAMLLFVWAASRLRNDWRGLPDARAWLGALLAFLAQLAVAAGYWGWHGMEGWGPRLILAGVPLLAPFAAVSPVRPTVLGSVMAVCFVINWLPLLQHPTPVATYVMNLRWPEIQESERWRYPFYATSESEANRPTVIPFEVLEQEPAANPWRLYLWFWRTSRLEGDALTRGLQSPPWADSLPELVPPLKLTPALARQLGPRPRFGFLGRSLVDREGAYATVYLDALLDQVIRANQQELIERALELSEKRLRLSTDGEAAAWRLETLRRANRALEAEALLRSLPVTVRQHPLINVSLALFDRDHREDQRARALLGSVIEHFRGTPAEAALQDPLHRWPATLDALTLRPRRDATVGRR